MNKAVALWWEHPESATGLGCAFLARLIFQRLTLPRVVDLILPLSSRKVTIVMCTQCTGRIQLASSLGYGVFQLPRIIWERTLEEIL